jgi:predicted DNA-binding protein with PD1-like motif
MASDLKVHVFRLKPHQDLKKSILEFAHTNGINAAVLLTCVGSLEQFHVRFADQKTGYRQTGRYEIVSLTGMFSASEGHFHLSLSDASGKVTGGHLLDENLIYTTAEIAIAELTDVTFHRELDSTYGFKELVIKPAR